MPHPNFFDFWEFSEILYYGTDLEILQNSARALCLAFFLGRKKTVFFHFFSVKFGDPGTLLQGFRNTSTWENRIWK